MSVYGYYFWCAIKENIRNNGIKVNSNFGEFGIIEGFRTLEYYVTLVSEIGYLDDV